MGKIRQFLTKDESPHTRILAFAGLFSWLQLMVSAYFAFVIAMYFWTRGRLPFEALERNGEGVEHFYMVMIFIVLVVYGWLHWCRLKTIRRDPFLNKPLLRTGAVCFFFLTLIVTLIRADIIPIWSDEYYQIQDAALDGPLKGSLIQHQAPLSYILSYGGHLLFGPSDISVRFHTAMVSALTFLSFYFLLFQVMRRSKLALFISILVSFSYFVLSYSIEARPQGFGFLFLIFYFFELIRFDQLARDKFLDRVMLTLSGLLFLLSLGFQPPFLMAMIILVYVLISLPYGRAIKSLKVAGLAVLAILLFLPYQIATAQISPPRIHSITISNLFDTFLNLRLPSLVHLGVVRNTFGAFSLTVLLISIFGFVLARKWTSTNSKQMELKARYGVVAILSGVLFLLTAHTFFVRHIEWWFQSKYLYLAIPMFFIALACAVAILTGESTSRRPLLIRIAGWGLSIFLVSQIHVSGFATVRNYWNYFDVQEATSLIQHEVSEDGILIAINGRGDQQLFPLIHYYAYKRGLYKYNGYLDIAEYTYEDMLRLVPDRDKFTLVIGMDNRKVQELIQAFQKLSPIWFRPVSSGLVITFPSPSPDNRELIDVLMEMRTVFQNWGWGTQSLERFMKSYQRAAEETPNNDER